MVVVTVPQPLHLAHPVPTGPTPKCVNRAERDAAADRSDDTERDRLKDSEREKSELKRANGILRKPAFSPAEAARRSKDGRQGERPNQSAAVPALVTPA